MPFVQLAQLRRSMKALTVFDGPLPLVTIPALFRAQVPLVNSQTEADNVPSEAPRIDGLLDRAFLDRFYTFPGAPPGKRYFVPGSGWVDPKFPTSSTQRQRSDRIPAVFFRSGIRYFPAGSSWPDFADRLANADKSQEKKAVLTTIKGQRQLIPLFDLACWLYRDVEVADPPALISHATEDLHIPTELLGVLFSTAIPPDADQVALGANPLTEADLAEVLNVEAPPPSAPTAFNSLVEEIENHLLSLSLVLAPGVVAAVVTAWLNRDIAVLVGAAGTGKSTYAEAIADALSGYVGDARTVKVAVGEDWTSAELIGYESLSGSFVARPVAKKILQSTTPGYPHILILDEFNLSKAEHYMPALLSAIESDFPTVTLTGAADGFLPIDTLIIATCNSPRDDPTSRIPVSAPTVQRMSVIPMPNVLRQKFESAGRDGIKDVITGVLRVEARKLKKRVQTGSTTWLDNLRRSTLGDSPSVAEIDDGALNSFVELVAVILRTKEGARWMTVRPLQDVALRVHAMPGEAQSAELVRAVNAKLIHIARESTTLQEIAKALEGLPGHEDLIGTIASLQNEHGEITPLV